MPSTTFITATESFAFIGPVGPVNIRKGETFHKDAKRLEGISDEAREKNFEPFSPDHDIETATAAPGERRRGRPRRSKTDISGPETDEDQAEDTPDESAETSE